MEINMRSLTSILVAASLASSAVAGEDWIKDFDEAVQLAQEQGKNLLVDFTGSDWCTWCIRLHDEVFQYDAFIEGTRDDFVLVYLDFPRSDAAKAAVPNPDRNRELAQVHGVRGYPTVLLMSPDEVVFGRTGYQQGGVDKYLKHLGDLSREPLMQQRRIREVMRAFEESDGGPEALGLVIEAAESGLGTSPFAGAMEPALRSGLEVEDEELRARAVTALVDLGVVDQGILAAAIEADPKNEQGLYGDALFAFADGVDTEDAIAPAARMIDAFFAVPELAKVRRESSIMLLVYGAHWNQNFLDDPERAREYARLGLERTKPQHRARRVFNQIARD